MTSQGRLAQYLSVQEGRQLHTSLPGYIASYERLMNTFGGALLTGNEGAVGNLVRLDARGHHILEDFVGFVRSPARAASCHEGTVGDHIGHTLWILL